MKKSTKLEPRRGSNPLNAVALFLCKSFSETVKRKLSFYIGKFVFFCIEKWNNISILLSENFGKPGLLLTEMNHIEYSRHSTIKADRNTLTQTPKIAFIITL